MSSYKYKGYGAIYIKKNGKFKSELCIVDEYSVVVAEYRVPNNVKVDEDKMRAAIDSYLELIGEIEADEVREE